jgi:hypothetical protein
MAGRGPLRAIGGLDNVPGDAGRASGGSPFFGVDNPCELRVFSGSRRGELLGRPAQAAKEIRTRHKRGSLGQGDEYGAGILARGKDNIPGRRMLADIGRSGNRLLR